MSVFPESSGKRALPKSTRRYAFSLTPLADAMLQLLIFFMLSSSMAAYSLLGLNSAAAPALGAGPALPAMVTGGEAPPGVAAWTVEVGGVVANGQRFGFDALPAMVTGLKQQALPQVVLVLGEGASVQDLVVVLEALAAGGIAEVQVATPALPEATLAVPEAP